MLKSSILSTNGALTDATTSCQGGRGSSDNESVLHIHQSSMDLAIPSDTV